MIPGDGIGPEISESVEKIFEAAKVDELYTTLMITIFSVQLLGNL